MLKNLKALRLAKDMSIDDLVLDLNRLYPTDKPVNKSMISRWERGVNCPSLQNAAILALYFNVSLDYLADLETAATSNGSPRC